MAVSDQGNSDPLNFAKGIATTLPPPFACSASYTTPSGTGQFTPAVIKQVRLLRRRLPRFADVELRGTGAGADAAACGA
ncbi:hypothetical protein B0H17DRAFT_1200436 [Mycena rosella]|uniref:Uncharacterized protein n=1 Tax=Mycena rosella TaxID=1033263 RepID=A0AAD7GJZ8_MYCRO|nr:hypothetical protein B0H17DRAFT_1200436 [Mycena rosella]